MAAPARGVVHRLLERAHSPDTANQIFADKIQHREQFVRPTSPGREEERAAASTTSAAAAASLAAAAAASAAAELAAAGAQGHNGREARRRSRRLKQEQRQHRARALKPKPLSSRQRRALEREHDTTNGDQKKRKKKTSIQYATFVPLHQLWLGYIREVLGPNELRSGGASAAAKLTAADFHGALIEVTRSACVSRVGTRGIVIRDTRFVFEVITPANEVKMVPKEGTFFRIEIPVEEGSDGSKNDDEKEATPDAIDASDAPNASTPAPAPVPKMVVELLGSQFMHRAIDRANRKFKQHFYKEL
ncbi:MAG: hypothetical protein STHCBS139747_003982 [Sporothrix thermara]